MEWKELEFTTQINAHAKKVWDIMLDLDTYKEWTNVAWPGSTYEGDWKKGSDIRFAGTDGSGTLARITELDLYQRIVATHIAILLTGGGEDRTSPDAKKWIGTTESYFFSEKDGKTNFTVKMKVTPDWEQMFNEGWPAALKKLKEMSER